MVSMFMENMKKEAFSNMMRISLSNVQMPVLKIF